ncbi:MAG: hypothetical protein HRT81_17860 [Henriciella sp.]|nr:hypothetical protein [Henriciella sp.]
MSRQYTNKKMNHGILVFGFAFLLASCSESSGNDAPPPPPPPANQAPTSVISGPDTAHENETISFSAQSSSDPDGSITSYRWEVSFDPGLNISFGDTTSESIEIDLGEFGGDNSFDVSLTVTDDDGATASSQSTTSIQSLEGADDNGDGISDDIEQFISADFGENTRVENSARNYALEFQKIVSAAPEDRENISPTATIPGSFCMKEFSSSGRLDVQRLSAEMLDTPQRQAAYLAHQRVHSMRPRNYRTDAELLALCDNF